MSLTVAVCTRARPEMLSAALGALAATVRDAEVVIVSQGSSRTSDACREAGLAATVVLDPGGGLSRARNIALAVAHGDVVLFTDDDCLPPVGWIEGHLQAHRSSERVGAAFGPVAGLTELPGAADTAALPPRPTAALSHPWLLGHGANMSVRRSAVLGLGGFDERFGPGRRWVADDHEMAIRLLNAGELVLSGVGPPVRHQDWREAGERKRAFRHYERGYGALVGKELRANPKAGTRLLRARSAYLRRRVTDDILLRHEPIEAAWAVAGFAIGISRGLAMRPWDRADLVARPNLVIESTGDAGQSAHRGEAPPRSG